MRKRTDRFTWFRSSAAAVAVFASLYLVAVAASARAAIATPQEQTAARSVWDAVYSESQATRGQEVYRQECAGCHLDSLGGADMAPAMVGDAFLTEWNDLTVGDLFERIRLSM